MPPPFEYSLNKPASQILHLAIQDILGEEDTRKLFNIPAVQISSAVLGKHIFRTLRDFLLPFENQFNDRARSGILYRVGKSFFEDLIRMREKKMGFQSLDYRTLPTSKRIYAGLIILATTINKMLGMDIRVEEGKESWFWSVLENPSTIQSRIDRPPVSYFMIGVLKAYISWATGEKNFLIEDTTDISTDVLFCKIQISRYPLS